MGFRFRKSKNFGPLRINLSKTGVGWSIGTKGVRYTKRADGKKQTTLSVPGTGLSYVEVSGNNKDSSNTNKSNNPNQNFSNHNNNDNKPKLPFYKRSLFIWLLLFFLPPVGIILLWTSKKYNKKPRIALSVIFAFYTMLMLGSNPSSPPSNNSIASNNTSITQEDNKDSDKEKIAQEKAAAEEAEKQKIAQEQAAAEEAEKQRIAQEKAAAEEAEKQRIAQEQAAAEEAEKQRVAQEQAAAEEAERQRVAQEQAAIAAQAQAQSNQNVQSSQAIGQTVYIASSGNGTKYHSNPNCSNMNGTIQLSVNDALNRGYTACKKCH